MKIKLAIQYLKKLISDMSFLPITAIFGIAMATMIGIGLVDGKLARYFDIDYLNKILNHSFFSAYALVLAITAAALIPLLILGRKISAIEKQRTKMEYFLFAIFMAIMLLVILHIFKLLEIQVEQIKDNLGITIATYSEHFPLTF